MDENVNLIRFRNEFIAAGVRQHLKAFYRYLVSIGALSKDTQKDIAMISSGNPFVILCKNEGVNKKFAEVKVLNWTWWNYYHNKRVNKYKKVIRTINLPRQWQEAKKLLITEEIPTLIPE